MVSIHEEISQHSGVDAHNAALVGAAVGLAERRKLDDAHHVADVIFDSDDRRQAAHDLVDQIGEKDWPERLADALKRDPGSGRDDEFADIAGWAAPIDPQTALAAIRYIDDLHKRADVYLRTAELMEEQQPVHAVAAVDEWSELPGNAESRDTQFSRMARRGADHGYQEVTVRSLDMISVPAVKNETCAAVVDSWSKVRPIPVPAAGMVDVASRISDHGMREASINMVMARLANQPD